MDNTFETIVESWIDEHERKNKTPLSIGNTRYVYKFIPGYIIKECTEFCDDDGVYCNRMEYNLYQIATKNEREFLNPTIGIYRDDRYIVSKESYPLEYYILEFRCTEKI